MAGLNALWRRASCAAASALGQLGHASYALPAASGQLRCGKCETGPSAARFASPHRAGQARFACCWRLGAHTAKLRAGFGGPRGPCADA